MAIRLVLATLLSLLSITCGAEVFKCNGPNGPILRNEPCQSGEKTISVDGVPWKKIAAEAERKRILEEEAKQAAEDRAAAVARHANGGNQWYQNSSRDYNPHTTEPCRGIVAEIRRLEQSPDFDRNRITRIELDNVMRLAMRLKCHF